MYIYPKKTYCCCAGAEYVWGAAAAGAENVCCCGAEYIWVGVEAGAAYCCWTGYVENETIGLAGAAWPRLLLLLLAGAAYLK